MRVIEQLVQHFWARGAITRAEARYLVEHGFVREDSLPGYAPTEHEGPGDWWAEQRQDERAREAEELEDDLAGRQAGGKKGGKKKKPSGHNLAPAAALLAGHFAARASYPALLELAGGLRPRATWSEAARVIAAARPDDLDAALVGLLNARPRALGELWFWFDPEPLFAWAEADANAGPVADGLARLLRAAHRNQVGRAGQLMKAPEFRDLADLLDARRAFLAMLPRLYAGSFPQLGRWLVPPAGDAAGCWPALPWAFVMVYNAKLGTADAPPPGYPVDPHKLPFGTLKTALGTAYPMDPVAVRELLIHRIRERATPLPDGIDWLSESVFDRPLYCPLNWRV